jgi:predicted site-specific integrase-resolvase
MSTIKYRGAQEIRKTYEISSETLRRWNNQGKISSIRTPGGNRLYFVVDVEKIFENQERINEKKKICYARVSSEKQKEDLDRQCEYLRQKCPDHELIKDIGSGLNWKRKGFTSILERSYQRDIEEVVVTHKDRLCRFAFELVEWIFSKHDTKIVVLGSDINVDDTESGELAEDLLSIVTIFTARHNGLRSAENRKRRREIENKKDTDLSNARRKRKAKKVDGNCKVDIQ